MNDSLRRLSGNNKLSYGSCWSSTGLIGCWASKSPPGWTVDSGQNLSHQTTYMISNSYYTF